MSFQNDNSTQLNITSVSYLASYTSITNPSILFSDRTSGIQHPTLLYYIQIIQTH